MGSPRQSIERIKRPKKGARTVGSFSTSEARPGKGVRHELRPFSERWALVAKELQYFEDTIETLYSEEYAAETHAKWRRSVSRPANGIANECATETNAVSRDRLLVMKGPPLRRLGKVLTHEGGHANAW